MGAAVARLAPSRRVRDLVAAQRRCALALLAANLVGAVVVFAVSIYVVPAPVASPPAWLDRANLILFAVALPLGLAVGGAWASVQWRRTAQWIADDRAPTPAERDATIRFPKRLVRMEAALWLCTAVPFTVLNGSYSSMLGLECAVEILLGGLTTCGLAFLLDERFSRPVVAEALERTPVQNAEPSCLSVRSRLALAWTVGAVVPLGTLVLMGIVALSDTPASRERIGLSVVLLAAVGVVAGLVAIVNTSRALADPLRALRTAVGRVEGGDLDAAVQVNDASEVGMLQAGFNRMVSGLRERDRLRDLFGRQVGEDVAREALQSEDVELGGETRDAAVLFVDLIGSTAMAASWEPQEVVSELNAFFAIVVDCVSLHGGWVNKFEGDAALCVFGAPTSHPDAAGAALATARVLRGRLERELPNLRAAVGVSAGTVVAGNVGTAERYEYTVIGDPVNEAARLTELAKQEPELLLASGAAVERSRNPERERWGSSRSVVLRGRSEPTVVATAL